MARGRPPRPIGSHGPIKTTPLAGGGFVSRAKQRQADGNTRRVTRTGRTKSEAENRLLEAMRDSISPGGSGDTLTADSKFSQASQLWLARIDIEVATGDKSPNTARLYRSQLTNHVGKALDQMRLREISTARVDALLLELRSKVGAQTARTARAVISGVCGLAVRHGAIAVNPTREASKITARTKRRPRALNQAERAQWRAQLDADPKAVRKDLPDLCEWLLATGVRIGEALAVGWDELEVPGLVRIDWTLTRLKGQGLARKSTKSEAGERVLPLPDFAVALVERRRAARLGDALPLFPDSRGGWRDPSNTSRDLREARGSEGFGWVTSHVFRKTCATILDDAGLSARMIADQLGHAQPSMTQNIYLDRTTVHLAAAAALDAAHRLSTAPNSRSVPGQPIIEMTALVPLAEPLTSENAPPGRLELPTLRLPADSEE